MRLKLKQARNRIELLRLALVSPEPEDLAAALPGLEEAVLSLAAVELEIRDGSSAPYEVRRELTLLKNDLRISAQLIEHGINFCRGWAKMLGAGPGYTQTGMTANARAEGTVWFRG
jgi:hypothetical protein